MSDLPSWARVGQKVVCVDASAGAVIQGRHRLVKGAIYELVRVGHVSGTPACQVCGQGLDAGRWMIDQCVRLARFRPLITRTQDEDSAMIRRLVDELPMLERAMLYEEVLNDDALTDLTQALNRFDLR